MAGLVLTRRINEKIMIGDDVVITLTSIKNRQATFKIEAPKGTSIDREEIYLKKQKELNP